MKKTLQVVGIPNEKTLNTDLYFVSDDEIREGEDAVTDTGIVCKVTFAKGSSFASVSKHCKKIHAASDPSLSALPIIPSDFIQYYVSKQGINVSEVEVEMEEILCISTGAGSLRENIHSNYKIKTNSSNEVIWSAKSEDKVYVEKTVIDLMQSYQHYILCMRDSSEGIMAPKEWIEENLK